MDEQAVPADTRPCAHCGREVAQRVGAGRPFRYCRDNDGACQRAARTSRMRHRNAPGLPGQVARTWEAVDRLDQLVASLTEALHAQLSPVGVERQLAQVRADAATQVAAAHTERDEARHDAEDAAAATVRAREQARVATVEQDTARAEAARAVEEASAAVDRADRASQAREQARREASAAQALLEQAQRDRDTARTQLRTAGAELAAQRLHAADLVAERDTARVDAQRATRAEAEAVEAARGHRADAEQARHDARQARAE
ncbi:hypothetical protein, partial [Salinispora arenicola]